MLLTGLLLVAALPVQGNLELTLNQAVYVASEAGRQLEISYDVPHSSLAFIRADTLFGARFRIGIDMLDGRGDPVGGDFEERSISVADYDLTVDRRARISGALTLGVPEGVRRVRVEVRDLNSQRRAVSIFAPAEGSVGLRLLFLRSGEVSPVRVLDIEDTLEVLAEALERPGPDSIRFTIGSGRRSVLARIEPVTDSAGRRFARLAVPMAEETGRALFPAGDYLLEATGTGAARPRAQARFRLDVPFHLDDAAWRERVDRLLWVATQEQMRELRAAGREDRRQAWREFWNRLDPVSAPGNIEREEQYFERIAYAEEHFGRGDRGYRSDRAQVYVKLGPPDQREARPFELDAHAYEIWSYYSLGLRFVFVDRYGFGEFVLENPRSVP